MTPVQIIGFPEEDSRVAEGLAANGCYARRIGRTSELQADRAVFVYGDNAGWLELLREIRALHPSTFLVVVTRIPDSSKWLEALEAGANDYCSLPLERQQVQWLIRSFHADMGHLSRGDGDVLT